jgi:hypothetical protein
MIENRRLLALRLAPSSRKGRRRSVPSYYSLQYTLMFLHPAVSYMSYKYHEGEPGSPDSTSSFPCSGSGELPTPGPGVSKCSYPRWPRSAWRISRRPDVSKAQSVPPMPIIPRLTQFIVAKFSASIASRTGLKCSCGFVFGS